MIEERAMRTSLALLLGGSLALTSATSSFAQPVDAATKTTARQLGEEGMHAMDKGDCATAVDRLTRAHDLVHVPTLALYAGKCLEKLGRWVDAGEMYLAATRDPVEPGSPGAVRAAPAEAEKARNALMPRIPTVQLSMQPPVPDAVLLLDGKPVPPAMIGVKRPIDPGDHVAELQRMGGVTKRPFSVREKESVSFVLDVPPPVAGYMYPGAPYPGAMYPYPGGPPVPSGPPPPPMVRQNTGLWVGGIVLIPVGAVAGLVGIYLAATGATFGAVGVDTGRQNAGYALMGLGLAGIVGGIVMVVIGGKKIPAEPPPAAAPAEPKVSFEPLLGPTSAGLRVRF